MSKEAAEPTLKERLAAEIEAALDRLEKRKVKAVLSESGEKRDSKTTKVLARSVEARFKKLRLWRKLQGELSREAVTRMVNFALLARKRREADEAQLVLPGFEHLPKRIAARTGRVPLARATVAQFLAHAARYEKRREKDERTLEQMRRVVEMVAGLAETDPDLPLAEAIARGQAAGMPAASSST